MTKQVIASLLDPYQKDKDIGASIVNLSSIIGKVTVILPVFLIEHCMKKNFFTLGRKYRTSKLCRGESWTSRNDKNYCTGIWKVSTFQIISAIS